MAKIGSRTLDLTGKRFGRLRVLSFIGIDSGRNAKWRCKCQCGNLTNALTFWLRLGLKVSCGCYNREISKRCNTTHGRDQTPEYHAFENAKQRCTNKKTKFYSHYGGRGIKFKFSSFEKFFAALGPKPSSSHALDRINNDGHYEAGNVRWVTRRQSVLNRRPWSKWKK